MRILLIMPPMTINKQSIKRCLIPMGLAYIAAAAEKSGLHEVSILDAMVEGYHQETYDDGYLTYGLSDNEILSHIRAFKPDVVGISCIMSSQLFNVLRVARLAKEASPGVKTIVGGLHPTFFPNDFLNSPDVDFVILEEGEKRLLGLLEIIKNGQRLSDFDGIAFKENGKITISPARSKIEDLDSLPHPARHLLPMDKYIAVNISLSPYPKEKRVAEVLSSRGCPNRCIFCASSNFWGHKFRPRSAENVISEIEQLKSVYNIEEIQFSDDNLTHDRERMKKICQGIARLKLKWCTPNGVYINSLDEELLKLMRKSGCYQITFSLESASPRVLLQIMHKDVDLKRIPGLVHAAHKLGISTHGTFVMGFPDESLQEIQADFELAYKLMFDSVSFFVVAPLPGSELYRRSSEAGLLKDFDAHNIDYKRSMLSLGYISADKLQELIDERMKGYNWRLLTRHPKRFLKKYGKFIIQNPRQCGKIFGRVT